MVLNLSDTGATMPVSLFQQQSAEITALQSEATATAPQTMVIKLELGWAHQDSTVVPARVTVAMVGPKLPTAPRVSKGTAASEAALG